jgi:(2Fe-2S) ferredoxin
MRAVPHFTHHVFVCTNERAPGDPKGDCKSKGGEEIRAFLKDELRTRRLTGRMRANAAGCLDQCAKGVAVVIYPEQTWYTLKSIDDAREMVEQHLVGGKVVERLLMDPPVPTK